MLLWNLLSPNFTFVTRGLVANNASNYPYHTCNFWKPTTTCWLMWRKWDFGLPLGWLCLTLIRTDPNIIPPICHWKSSLMIMCFYFLFLKYLSKLQRTQTKIDFVLYEQMPMLALYEHISKMWIVRSSRNIKRHFCLNQ